MAVRATAPTPEARQHLFDSVEAEVKSYMVAEYDCAECLAEFRSSDDGLDAGRSFAMADACAAAARFGHAVSRAVHDVFARATTPSPHRSGPERFRCDGARPTSTEWTWPMGRQRPDSTIAHCQSVLRPFAADRRFAPRWT